MEQTTIYLMFTDTGTTLSHIINYYTKRSLNHVSIGFDPDLSEVYSFGRTQSRNPFSGGFVREDIRGEFLRDANCAIYSFSVTKQECNAILRSIKRVENRKHDYRYNFIGLFGILLHIEIKRKRAYFCSEFVATVLRDVDSITLSKPSCFITPEDIRNQIEMHLVYEGKLCYYRRDFLISESKLITETEITPKQSLIFSLSQKVKQFVIR